MGGMAAAATEHRRDPKKDECRAGVRRRAALALEPQRGRDTGDARGGCAERVSHLAPAAGKPYRCLEQTQRLSPDRHPKRRRARVTQSRRAGQLKPRTYFLASHGSLFFYFRRRCRANRSRAWRLRRSFTPDEAFAGDARYF